MKNENMKGKNNKIKKKKNDKELKSVGPFGWNGVVVVVFQRPPF